MASSTKRPTFTLRPARYTDTPRMSLIRSLAFGPTDPIQAEVWPRSLTHFEEYVEHGAKDIEWEMRLWDWKEDGEGRMRFTVAVNEDDEVVATAQWQILDGTDEDRKGTEGQPVFPGTNQRLMDDYFGRQHVVHDELLGKEAHVYILILTTHPDFQGQGSMSLLIRHILSFADAQGIPAYLSASPAGEPVYLKYGWEEIQRFKCTKEGGWKQPFEHVLMIRQPNAAKK